MKVTRRALLVAAGSLPLQGNLVAAAVQDPPTTVLPAKDAFAPTPITYLNSAAWHPISLGARRAVEDYLAHKSLDPRQRHFDIDDKRTRAVRAFARLINADGDEVCFVQSTTAGENLVVQALDLPAGSRVVIDALHFPGSFYLYQELGRRGIEVVTLRPRDNRIALDQIEAAVSNNTRLVALSLVSMVNGFEHDLTAVCDIAHAKGALVYADLAQAAGSVPIDVKASGVDFAACATYKWLMGDMGLGFLFVRKAVLPRLRRPWFGYRQIGRSTTHIYPYDPPGDSLFELVQRTNTAGYFEMGTTANAVAVQLAYSLEWLLRIGVETIRSYRQPMLAALQQGLARRGLEPMTPPETTAPLVAFACRNARQRFGPRLEAANIDIALSEHRLRVSPSIFNDMNDVDRFLEALS